MDEIPERESIIPKWCAEIAAGLVKNYGSDQALLQGAIAAALHTERERCAGYHDDMVAEHQAAIDSSASPKAVEHHRTMARRHAQYAAAIRKGPTP